MTDALEFLSSILILLWSFALLSVPDIDILWKLPRELADMILFCIRDDSPKEHSDIFDDVLEYWDDWTLIPNTALRLRLVLFKVEEFAKLFEFGSPFELSESPFE